MAWTSAATMVAKYDDIYNTGQAGNQDEWILANEDECDSRDYESDSTESANRRFEEELFSQRIAELQWILNDGKKILEEINN
jgi:hypothetical protein